jgi:stage V sporulation protein R
MQFILEHSEFLGDGENKWMRGVVEIVRKTSLFFQPQIRTKILNEGWASYWHETLFLRDDRIRGHEVDFARVNAGVVSMPRVGLNPYALGMKLFQHIEEQADRGRLSAEYRRMLDAGERERFDAGSGNGRETIFTLRENLSDFLLIHHFVDQEFVDRNRLFVAGRHLDRQRMVWQYYVKSRDAGDYRRMLYGSLYHPPHIIIEHDKCTGKTLYLNHVHEGKPLVRDFIANTLLGIEYLWGGPVKLETSEVEAETDSSSQQAQAMFPGLSKLAREEEDEPQVSWQRVLYTMQNRKLTRSAL